MAGIRLIVGLGNVGAAYEATRHNAGFWFVDRIVEAYRGSLENDNRFHGQVGRLNIAGSPVWLLQPTTLMNLSGRAVSGLANFYKIQRDQILVAHDELDMMPGQVRIKRGGGVAGHNGLKDIRARCGGDEFWRLRIGIGHPRELGMRQPVVDFVLRPPSQADADLIDGALSAALAALPDLVAGRMNEAMLALHTAAGKPPARPSEA